MSSTVQKTWDQVWDPLVRYGHWALVGAFAVAYLSAEEESGGPDQFHIWAGYAVGIIVAVRVLWGLVGTRDARFSDFAYSPATALKYLADMLRGRGRRYVGHSPAAAYMIVALLVCLTATVGTGLVAYGNSGKGPLASARGLVIAEAHAERAERASSAICTARWPTSRLDLLFCTSLGWAWPASCIGRTSWAPGSAVGSAPKMSARGDGRPGVWSSPRRPWEAEP